MKTRGKYRFWLCVRAYSRVSLPPFGKFLARVPAVNRETAELRFEGKGKVFPFNGRDCCAPASRLRGSKAKSNEFSRLSEVLPMRWRGKFLIISRLRYSREDIFSERDPHRRSNHPIESCRVIINYDISHVTYRYPLAQLIKGSPESKRGGDIVHDRSLGEDDRCVHRKSSSRTIPGCLFETSRRKFTNRDT